MNTGDVLFRSSLLRGTGRISFGLLRKITSSIPQAHLSRFQILVPVERFVKVRRSVLHLHHRLSSPLWGQEPRGGGLYRESQWRQQTRRCTRICPQRYESDRPVLELEVRGEVDWARRSSGGRVLRPLLRELVPPITSKATVVASAAQLGQQHTTTDE